MKLLNWHSVVFRQYHKKYFILQFVINSIQFVFNSISPTVLKVGLSPSKKNFVICVIESPLKMMKNAFYFILKAFFVLKIFKFLSRLFGHIGKTA